MEPKTQTYYLVEIGSADLYFERLEDAAEFFAKIAKAPIKNIQRTYEKGETLHFIGTEATDISMKQETLVVYPNKKAASFAVADKKEEE